MIAKMYARLHMSRWLLLLLHIVLDTMADLLCSSKWSWGPKSMEGLSRLCLLEDSVRVEDERQTLVRYSVLFQRGICRCSKRKVGAIQTVTSRARATLSHQKVEEGANHASHVFLMLLVSEILEICSPNCEVLSNPFLILSSFTLSETLLILPSRLPSSPTSITKQTAT